MATVVRLVGVLKEVNGKTNYLVCYINDLNTSRYQYKVYDIETLKKNSANIENIEVINGKLQLTDSAINNLVIIENRLISKQYNSYEYSYKSGKPYQIFGKLRDKYVVINPIFKNVKVLTQDEVIAIFKKNNKSFLNAKIVKKQNSDGYTISAIKGNIRELKAYDLEIRHDKLIKYNGEARKLLIPPNIKVIGKQAFKGNTNIEQVIFPKNLQSIEDEAFKDCTSLNIDIKQINMGVALGEDVFKNTANYVENDKGLHIIGNTIIGCTGYTYNYEQIRDDDRYYDIVLDGEYRETKLVIPKGITHIGKGAFAGCTVLEEVIIPEGVISIGYGAFNGCTNLKKIQLPTSLKCIEDSAFAYCQALKTIVNIDKLKNCKHIGNAVFYDSLYVKNHLCKNPYFVINNTLLNVDALLDTIIVPEGVLLIRESAFVNVCPNIKNKIKTIQLASTVKNVEPRAFIKCAALTEVRIPKNSTLKEIEVDTTKVKVVII